MSDNKNIKGNLLALLTIIIWGTTFISTKILLKNFSPIEILFFRFTIGFLALFFMYPHKLKITEKKQELYFMAAGLCGVTLYFLLENIALTYSFASNVGVIIAIAPFFTAIFAHLFLEGERLNLQFFVGFFCSIVGIIVISFNGSTVLKLNPLGDILAVIATIMWSVYSIIVKKIGYFKYNAIQTTRRIFFYGLIFMLPILFLFDFKLDLNRFTDLSNTLNILYLGLGASAVCFVTWNSAVNILGAVKTSIYIYIVPVITILTSIIVLKEKITLISFTGIMLIIIGLYISENKFIFKFEKKCTKI